MLSRAVKRQTNARDVLVVHAYVEEIDNWHDESVDDSEDDICLVPDTGERDWSHHDNHEVESPI